MTRTLKLLTIDSSLKLVSQSPPGFEHAYTYRNETDLRMYEVGRDSRHTYVEVPVNGNDLSQDELKAYLDEHSPK